MTSKLFTGKVLSVELQEREPYGNQYKYQWKENKELTIKFEIELTSGEKAFFNTPAAKVDFVKHVDIPFAKHTWKTSKTAAKWYNITEESGEHYYRDYTLRNFPKVYPTVSEGDIITVSGSYSKRTSRAGNEYYQLKRVALKNIVD